MLTKATILANLRSESDGIGSKTIVADDEDKIDPPIRRLFVEVGGTVTFEGIDGVVDTWTVPDNYTIRVAMQKVKATGTAATGLHGIY